MKKLTTILLAVAMTLPLVACGGGNAGNTNGGNTNSGSTDKHTHVEEVMPAVEPTCTKTGLTEGKRCSECGEVLVAQETVPALGRTTESGTCERCGQSFGDWRIDYSVDDFNQPTDEWYITEDEYLVGTFSNSATTNSELYANVMVDLDDNVMIFLYEYGSRQVKNSSELPKNEIRERVEHMLALVKLTGMDKRYPRQLSGGQQQRVALARALVTRPSILLLDEPLSNLDAKLRVEMQVEIKRIQKELGITTIIVTHDHEEAVSLADRVIVMNAGHILQIGKPQEVFDRPASPFIADFMGFSTFLHGIAAGAEGDMRLIRCGAHTLQVPAEAAQELSEGDACILAIRSENIRTAEQEGVNTVRGTVKSATYKGHTTRLEVSGCFEEMVYPAIHEYADVQEGSEVLLHFPAQHFCVYKDIK